jgi:predicted nucleic acid-binding protein
MVDRVVDASAFGALLFGESAQSWVQDQTRGEVLIAPMVLHFELGNVCWVKMRRNPKEADALLTVWMDWASEPPVMVVDIDLIDALRVARDHHLTFYDASYLWLAQERAADLISLDGQLVRAARRLGLRAPAQSDGPADHTTPRARN